MLNNFKKYPSYKDSKIEWLGAIPAHWQCIRLGSEFEERREKVSDKDFEALSVTKNGIVPQLENAAKSNDGENRKGVKKGDFVINSRSDRKGSSGIALQDGSVSLINIVLKPKSIFPKYSEYLLKSHNFIEEYYRYGHGIVADLWTTRYSEMKAMPIPLPPLPEQTAIANFLDKKTAEIKEFIALKEKTIELLKERKMAIINQAVTKGLDPTVEMKDSGIEWLGKIPKHWEVKKLKYLSYCKNNQRIPIESSIRGQMKNPLYDYYGATGVIDKVDDYIFDEDLILIAEDGANLLMRNIQLVYIAKGKYWVNNHAHIFKPKKNMNIEYLASSMEVFDYTTLISGSAQPKLTKYAILNVPLIQPPFNEQNEIMVYVQKISAEINEVISNAEREINLIKEYQQSLISEVVTGKVDVSALSEK